MAEIFTGNATQTAEKIGKAWTIEDARNVYNIRRWSEGFFDINAQGELIAKPCGPDAPETVTFPALLEALKSAGLTLPVLVRFSNILHARVEVLYSAFAKAKAHWDYKGDYTPVYPIKVNQQRRVVEQILGSGKGVVGLEAGSKPELMVVLALSVAGSVIICNGYKDREYIRLALIGCLLGHQVYLIVEKLSELALILEESARMGVKPLLGVRVRLSSIGKGKWQNTGGEKSKFGLTASQVISMISKLKESDQLDCLALLHCHLGSQIGNLQDIDGGISEAAQYFIQLHALGATLRVVDVGGGLGVDYEGTQSTGDYSINYSVEAYASVVVGAFARACQTLKIPHPNIITEAGRAMTAHHAVLLTQVIARENLHSQSVLNAPSASAPAAVQAIWQAYQDHVPYEACTALLGQIHRGFNRGELSIEDKAQGEEIYYAYCYALREHLRHAVPQGPLKASLKDPLLDELDQKLADKLFCNFSLFQSTPDAWAIKQIFPIMPLQGLLVEPTQRAILQDLTCDSDGCIDYYVDGQGIESSLPLPPPLMGGSPYCLGLFLVGAYQEILGDMHNLFGDTDSVHVEFGPQGKFHLAQPLLGDRVDSVLRTVHFEPQELMQSYKRQLERAVLSPQERRSYLDMLASGLTGYTYLEEEI